MCSSEEPSGVRGVERWHSRCGNRRDPSPPWQRDPQSAILRVDQEQACPISRVTVKWARAERESERPTVPSRPWQQNHGGGKGPYLVCGFVGGKRW
jgi:hypothetical protein